MLTDDVVLWLLAIYVFVIVLACVALVPNKKEDTEETADISPGDKWFKYEDVDLGQPGPTIVTIVSITEEGDVKFKNNSSPIMSLPIDVFLSLFRKLS